MLPLTTRSGAVVLRTDFSDPETWDAVAAAITAVGTGDEEGFAADVELRDDPAYAGVSVEQVLALAEDEYEGAIVVVVDSVAMTDPEHPVLVVCLDEEDRGDTFRALPGEIQSIENNLSLANMDWIEFAEAVDVDGVFRGF